MTCTCKVVKCVNLIIFQVIGPVVIYGTSTVPPTSKVPETTNLLGIVFYNHAKEDFFSTKFTDQFRKRISKFYNLDEKSHAKVDCKAKYC